MLLGTLVALPMVTLGNRPRTMERVGACEPDGTTVADAAWTPVIAPYQRLEAQLNEFADPRGYHVALEKVENRAAIAGYVFAKQEPDLHCCFFVPLAMVGGTPSERRDRAVDVLRYIRWRTFDAMRQLDRAALWAD